MNNPPESQQLARLTPQQSVSPFASAASFVDAQRMARLLASCSFAPAQFRGEENLGNVLIAWDMSQRMNIGYMTLIQNMDVIFNKPAFKSTFIIGSINTGGRFTPLKFEYSGTPGKDDYGCRAVATDKATGEVCTGTVVDIKMAKAEGWYARKDSKWPNMAPQMLAYRAACFWQRLYAPEATLGLPSSEEVRDMAPPEPDRPEIRKVKAEMTPAPELPPPDAPAPGDLAAATGSNPDRSAAVAGETDVDALRAFVTAEFKREGIKWSQVQSLAKLSQWWDAPERKYADIGLAELKFLSTQIEKIAKTIRAGAVIADVPEGAAPAESGVGK